MLPDPNQTGPVRRTPFGFDRLARWGLLLLLAYGCWRVLEPFIAAILFSLAIAISRRALMLYFTIRILFRVPR